MRTLGSQCASTSAAPWRESVGQPVALRGAPTAEIVLPATPWSVQVVSLYQAAIERYEDLGRRAPLRFAALTVILVFGLVFAIFEPGFDTNDDAVMNMIVAGKGYGLAPDEHMVFTNVLIGFVLKYLYTVFPTVPWYGGYLLAVHFVVQVTMLYCVVRTRYTRLRLRLYLAYFAAAELYLLNNLQFTSTAFLAGQAGILLLMLAMRRSSSEGRWLVRVSALGIIARLFGAFVTDSSRGFLPGRGIGDSKLRDAGNDYAPAVPKFIRWRGNHCGCICRGRRILAFQP